MQKSKRHRLVVLESPYAGDVEAHVGYLRACMADCLVRGESPYASHGLLTQPGVLDDASPAQRAQGMAAGWAWAEVAEAVVFYLDYGMSGGMASMKRHLAKFCPGRATEWRFLPALEYHAPSPQRSLGRGAPLTHAAARHLHFPWEAGFCSSMPKHSVAEMPLGRLEVALQGRSPTPAAPFEVILAGRTIAFYMNMTEARHCAEAYYAWHAAQADPA